MTKQTKALAKIQNVPMRPVGERDIFDLAARISKEDVPVLEALIKMRAAEEERQAKRMFEEKFAEMQKEYPAVKRTKAAKKGNEILYAYCPLENILVVYGPILTAHGFSFSWTEAPVEGQKNEKRVTCNISGWGYTKSASMDIPIEPATSFANAIQQRAISTSYGKRYTFCSAVGVIIAGEDLDGQTQAAVKPAEKPGTSKDIEAIKAALQAVFALLTTSGLFSDEELQDRNQEYRDTIARLDLIELRALRGKWDKELNDRKRGKK